MTLDLNVPPLRITAATEDDAPLVYQIMQIAFAEFRDTLYPPSSAHDETVADVLKMMREGGAALAWLGDQAVASARYAFREDYCYVGRVSVLPEQRGKGIASALMRHIESIACARQVNHMEIAVRMVLESNVNLYRRLGYAITELHVHPRGDGQQKFATMRKPL